MDTKDNPSVLGLSSLDDLGMPMRQHREPGPDEPTHYRCGTCGIAWGVTYFEGDDYGGVMDMQCHYIDVVMRDDPRGERLENRGS